MRPLPALLAVLALALPAPAPAQDSADLAVLAELGAGEDGRVPLYLQATVNGRDTNLVAEFDLDPASGTLASPRSELEELGLQPAPGLRGLVELSALPGLRYRYDATAQTIALEVPPELLHPEVVSAFPEAEQLDPEPSFGAVLNYSLDASHTDYSSASALTGTAATLDARIFSPLGTLRSTGVLRETRNDGAGRSALRLETSWQMSSPKRRLTLEIGDLQSSGLGWTRPIRLGGVQLRRDFGLRPDLVTQQLLAFDGAAAVPSTVDVFIDNARTYSTSRDAGPFRLEDLPARTGANEALIVVTDANGRRSTRAVSFYVSQKLLKQGLADFSIEAGRAREAYGLSSNRYGAQALLSGSLRYGLSPRLTLEAHAEGKADLAMAGLGLVTTPFNLAELSLATGASRYRGEVAGFAWGALQTRIGGARLSGSLRLSQAGFADLAYATGVDYLGESTIAESSSLLETPRMQGALNLALPMPGGATLGLGYVASRRSHSDDALVNLSYGRELPGLRGSLSVYGAQDLDSGETRAAVGMTLQLGNRRSLRSTASVAPQGGFVGGLHLSRAISDRQGDYGYAAQIERRPGSGIRFAGTGEYRGRYGKAEIEAQLGAGATTLGLRLDGAVAFAGGALALGNSVADSFAIVDVGAPGVPVAVHNRRVAITDFTGKALVTGLQSNHRNRVSVDVDDLPENLALEATAQDVVPGIGAGVRVKFRGATAQSALVVLLDAAGKPLEAGATAQLAGSDEPAFVGFDGETLVEGLGRQNHLQVAFEGGSCGADFAFAAQPGPMQRIEGVICR